MASRCSHAGLLNPEWVLVFTVRHELHTMVYFTNTMSLLFAFCTRQSLSPPEVLSPDPCLPLVCLHTSPSWSRLFSFFYCSLFSSLSPHVSLSTLTFPLPPLMHIRAICFISTNLSVNMSHLHRSSTSSPCCSGPLGDAGIETWCMCMLSHNGWREFPSVQEFF